MQDNSLEIFATMSSNLFSSGAPEAQVERGEAVVGKIGYSYKGRRNTRLYEGIDVVGALAKPLQVNFTTNYAMSVASAAKVTTEMLARLGLRDENANVQYFFVQSMLLCFAVNSSSVLMPDRAEFQVIVKGVPQTFNFFTDVLNPLGADARRYFRAYADETRTALQRLERDYAAGPQGGTEQAMEAYESVRDMWAAVIRVANDRGLARVPTLIHDSAENCSLLTASDLAFLGASKKTIFNVVGRTNPADNPVSARTPAGAPAGAIANSAPWEE